MMSFSERIKGEAIDSFDNFIVQAILPNDDEIKGIQEHNGFVKRNLSLKAFNYKIWFNFPTQSNHLWVPRSLFQPLQSFSDPGSWADGKVSYLQ